MDAIIDSATDFNAVNGASCSQCGEKYDIEGNLENGSAFLSDDPKEENYGKSLFKGREATDKVCFVLTNCFDVEFLYVDQQESLDDDVGAIFGFARPNESFAFGNSGTQLGNPNEMILTKLQESGEEPIFSTRFVRDFISWIDIGTPDLSQNKEEPVTITNIPDFFWSMKMEGVRFGEKKENAWTFSKMEEGAERNGGIYTIFDTGASNIYLSVLWFESFVE